MSNLFSFRKPSAHDTAARLAACTAHLEAAESELATRREAYERAIVRSAADADVKTETAEAKRMHGFYVEQRAAVERAHDAVAAAERLHAEAAARENRAATAELWDRIEALGADRTAAAAAVELHAAALATAIEAFRQRNEALHAALPHKVAGHVDFGTLTHWRQLVATELARAGITRDATGARVGFPLPPDIGQRASELEIIVRRHRPHTTDAQAA